MFLSWITAAVRAAVLKGFAEAVQELDMTTDVDAPPALDALRARMALPAPEPSQAVERTNGRRAAK